MWTTDMTVVLQFPFRKGNFTGCWESSEHTSSNVLHNASRSSEHVTDTTERIWKPCFQASSFPSIRMRSSQGNLFEGRTIFSARSWNRGDILNLSRILHWRSHNGNKCKPPCLCIQPSWSTGSSWLRNLSSSPQICRFDILVFMGVAGGKRPPPCKTVQNSSEHMSDYFRAIWQPGWYWV